MSIAIEADQTAFQHYSSGVRTGNCGTSPSNKTIKSYEMDICYTQNLGDELTKEHYTVKLRKVLELNQGNGDCAKDKIVNPNELVTIGAIQSGVLDGNFVCKGKRGSVTGNKLLCHFDEDTTQQKDGRFKEKQDIDGVYAYITVLHGGKLDTHDDADAPTTNCQPQTTHDITVKQGNNTPAKSIVNKYDDYGSYP